LDAQVRIQLALVVRGEGAGVRLRVQRRHALAVRFVEVDAQEKTRHVRWQVARVRFDGPFDDFQFDAGDHQFILAAPR